MICAVLDTNILAAAFVNLLDSGRARSVGVVLVQLWTLNRFGLIVSEAILGELARVFERPYFTERFTADYARESVELLRSRAQVVEPAPDVHGFAPHPSDDLILGTAVAGHADYLVTGDRALRRLGTFRGVRLVSPLVFIDAIRAADVSDP